MVAVQNFRSAFSLTTTTNEQLELGIWHYTWRYDGKHSYTLCTSRII